MFSLPFCTHIPHYVWTLWDLSTTIANRSDWSVITDAGLRWQYRLHYWVFSHGRGAALTWWDEQSLALLQTAFVTLVDLVGEEHLAVIGRWPPALVQRQVGGGGLDEEEDLLPLQTQTPSRYLAQSSASSSSSASSTSLYEMELN